jgi:serine/threonine protein kinase
MGARFNGLHHSSSRLRPARPALAQPRIALAALEAPAGEGSRDLRAFSDIHPGRQSLVWRCPRTNTDWMQSSMKEILDYGRLRVGAESALRSVLQARMSGELGDDEFVRAIRGTCTQREFIDTLSAQLHEEPQSVAQLMALVNRLHKRGDISAELVQVLESRLPRAEQASAIEDAFESVTVDLGIDAAKPCVLVPRPVSPQIAIGSVLRGRYEIEQCLGSGGKGTVFKAIDRYRSGQPPPQRYVAIKLLHQLPGHQDELIGALRRELQCAQTLSHPNIVKVHDVDRDGDVDFFTMELVQGELLSDLIRRFRPLPMTRALACSIIRQIAAGLEHAHARKIVHADLKPQNIMVTNSGEVRILDFGSACGVAKNSANEPSFGGSSSATPAYASCELLEGRSPDPRDDLYSLACIAYELLSGTHPFQRRRATEARDFGVVPTRPAGFSGRRWRTLSRGLSFHRAGRSIAVGDWCRGLNLGAQRPQSLIDMGASQPAPVSKPRPVSLRPSAVFSLLLGVAAVSLLFVRLAPGGKVSGEALRTTSSIDSTPDTQQTGLAAGAAAAISTALRAVATPSAANRGMSILPSEYRAQPGQHFAEIRVHRPVDARSDGTLTWWTEPASARPGIDYVSQNKVSQSFPKGRDSMSFFVKLLPQAKRSQAEVFYVAVANRSDNHAGEIMHTAVRLPSNGGAY